MRNFFLLFLLPFLLLPGCARQTHEPLLHNEIVELNAKTDNSSYVLKAGDRIFVKFFFSSSLNDEVVVRPDGKISLQLIDEVQAAGLTTEELDAVLTEAYAKAFKTSSDKYVLAVADQIVIKSYYNERLNDKVVVRPDGKISLQLIDEVQAAGFTPAELDALLTARYAEYFESTDLSVIVTTFNRPDLTVIVHEFSDQKIYIGGEVKQPGIIRIAGRLRVLDAIIQAAGSLESGDLSRVVLIRQGPAREPEVYSVNVQDVLAGKTQDISLNPYDIVYVPKTDIANIEQFVRNYLWDLLPRQVMFSFLYNWNPEVQVER